MDSTQARTKRKHDDIQQDDEDSNYERSTNNPLHTHDIQATPRASELNNQQSLRTATPSLSSAESVSSSQSRTSSPTKQLKRLALEADGFVHRKFATKRRAELPPSLNKLVEELKSMKYGVKILAHHMRTEYEDFEIPDDAFFSEGHPMSPGLRFPPRDLVNWLRDQGEDCELNLHGEPSWNTELHLPMMEWALRSNRQHGLVDYTYCPGAKVTTAYKAKSLTSNVVDFCMVIRPPEGSPEADRINAVRENRPDVTINHTEHGILCKSPIVVSFETKRPGEDEEKAMMQMGSWHTSQWRGLRHRRHKMPAIQFLPGVTIIGHRWTFVASVMQGEKSIFYSGIEFGNTSTEFGIIITLLALNHLARWAEDTYWPMFKSEVLEMPPDS
ncbi:hypothetical protein K4K55_008210 [Colletotrichum sp. SAR 10_96]|nr:hypothetical protein K4K55_008210 [Colletotrichum sp. SAR 10_96]